MNYRKKAVQRTAISLTEASMHKYGQPGSIPSFLHNAGRFYITIPRQVMFRQTRANLFHPRVLVSHGYIFLLYLKKAI